MIARGFRYLAMTVLLVIVLVIAAGYWILHTESGSAWAWQRVRDAAPGELSAAAFEGAFTEGVRLRTLVWANPSLEVTAERLRLAIDPAFFPPALTIEVLDAGGVVVRQRARPEPAPQEPGRFSPESLVLPLGISLRALILEDLRVLNPAGEEVFAVRRAELAGRWHESIVLSRLAVDTSVGAARGSAALSLHEPFEASGSLQARYPFGSGPDAVPIAFAADVAGNLSDLRVRLDGETPNVVVEGRLLDVLDAREWDLEAQSARLQWPLSGAEPTVTLTDLVVASRGSTADYTLSGSGALAALAGKVSLFSFDATGDGGGLDIGRLRLDGPVVTADAEGALEWRGGFGFRVDADVARFDPAALTAEWPSGVPVRGRAVAAFRPGKLELESVHAEVADSSGQADDVQVDVRGLIDLDTRVVDLSLDWRNLRWPVARDRWRFRSDSGGVAVTGRPDDWALDGRIALQTPELPPGTFELAGHGSRGEATVTIEDSQVLGGTVAGRLHYARPEGGRWSADLAAAGIDTGALAAAWPGEISADLVAEGRIEPLELALDIEELSGTLRGRPLEGSGGFRWARGNLAVQDLEIASGESRLTADGSLRSEQGLDFALEVPKLSALVRRAAGELHAAGTLSLAGGFPRAELAIDARDLVWRDWRLGRLEVTAAEGAEPLMVELDARALAVGGVRSGRFRADLTASETRQQLEAAATLDGRQVEVALDGRLVDWQRPLAAGWSGRLQAVALNLADDLQYRLEAPAGLTLARDRIDLERACLRGDAAGRICLAGNHAGPGDYRLSADLENLPANLVKQVVQTELEFTQTLDGSLLLRSTPGRRMSADARIDIAPGRVHDPENPRMALITRAGSFRLDLDAGQVLLARLDLPVGKSAALNAEFAMDDVRRGDDSGIRGRVEVNVYDISVLAALVPSITRAGGHLKVDLALGGTVAKPVLDGDASLTNGLLSYAPLGLELKDIELRSRIARGNHIDLQSTFTAGEGSGRLYSSADGLGAGEVRLTLTGDNLTVVDLPQVNVVADVDVGVGVTPERVTLNGDVRVPKARLSPREITTTRVSESKDVVIVASRREEDEEPAAEPPPFAIEGEVELTLGDDVVIDFDAAETQLSGAVTFAWNGPPMPIATGEYEVTGRFEAYGQLLEITEGSIRFPEVPATNPQLRIRAEREIFGNPQIRTAGVLVSGTAQDPEVEVYTAPATTRERALTLLVTGSDFDYEQGVGAVDVGTYIAPDLYLSYGIGLFDRENVISVRYDIARGFGIKATSGQSAEGVDLSYTFER